jgi:hypothetical protein
MYLKRLRVIIFLCGGWWAMATQAEPIYAGGNGLSIEQAVIITGAQDETEGVHTEYAWLSEKYPGHKRGEQSLVSNNNHFFDRLVIQTKNGQSVVIYFDITSFFGKLN